MKRRTVSVVVPCFNEEKIIFRNLLKINSFLKENFSDFEIIVVNDGSTDTTQAILKKVKEKIEKIKIIYYFPNQGKGKAVKTGIMSAKNNLVLFLDADLAVPVDEIRKFIEEMENKNWDLVIASRSLPGVKLKKEVLWYRKIMEKFFQILRKIIVNTSEIKDTQCGFKLFKKDAAQKIFSLSLINRFAFDAEIIFLAKKMNYKIKEMPITLQNPTVSHINLFFDPINMFFDLIKIRVNDWTGKYDRKE